MVERSVLRHHLFVYAYHRSFRKIRQFTANHPPVNQISPFNPLKGKGEREVVSLEIGLKGGENYVRL